MKKRILLVLPRSRNGDELDRLTEVFNAMTKRLGQSFTRIRDFTLHFVSHFVAHLSESGDFFRQSARQGEGQSCSWDKL